MLLVDMAAELLEISRFLAAHAPFDALPPETLNATARELEVGYYRRGQRILAFGEPNHRLFVVRSGAAELRDEQGTLVARLGEGEAFGYPSLLTDNRVRYGVTALEDSLVYELPEASFHRLRRRHEAFDRFFGQALAGRIRLALEGLQGADGSLLLTARAHELVKRPPVWVEPGCSIREAARTMKDERVSSLLVMAGRELLGIVTDRDLRNRVVAEGAPLDAAVTTIMTPRPITAHAQSYVFEVLLTMTRHNLHHLPVTDGETVLGLITATDLMQQQTVNPVYLVGEVHKQESPAGLAEVCRRLPELVSALTQAQVRSEDIGRVVTAFGDAVTRRLLSLAEGKLGRPPMTYSWLVFGSQARAEQTLLSDQDNALLLSNEADEEERAYFERLANYVNDGLHACGYAYCPGEVMAKNPRWRQSLAGWARTFESWITRPEPEALLGATIFFDLRHVRGEADLSRRLQESILAQTAKNEIFTAHLARTALTHGPPLGFFRNFVLEKGGEHHRTFDLKHRGVVPIVDLARVHALANGVQAVNTFERLSALTAAGALSQEGGRDLQGALEFIASVRLRHQVRLLKEERAPDNHVDPAALSSLERRHLKDAFAVVSTMQSAMGQAYGLRLP